MNVSISQIIEWVDALPEEDVDILQQHLKERAKAAWSREVERERTKAMADGIDQKMIDDAVMRHRYGE